MTPWMLFYWGQAVDFGTGPTTFDAVFAIGEWTGATVSAASEWAGATRNADPGV